jgi:hypothetical protein
VGVQHVRAQLLDQPVQLGRRRQIRKTGLVAHGEVQRLATAGLDLRDQAL